MQQRVRAPRRQAVVVDHTASQSLCLLTTVLPCSKCCESTTGSWSQSMVVFAAARRCDMHARLQCRCAWVPGPAAAHAVWLPTQPVRVRPRQLLLTNDHQLLVHVCGAARQPALPALHCACVGVERPRQSLQGQQQPHACGSRGPSACVTNTSAHSWCKLAAPYAWSVCASAAHSLAALAQQFRIMESC